tara:strand:+ start:1239 stop:2345 length:1107 start_codon:yes stop_codon:yes gene_type:complete
MLIFKYIESINLLYNKKYDLVFYSESKNYNKLFYPLIKNLSKKKEIKILYASSDEKDKLFLDNVENLFIGKGFILSILFNLINAKVLITTTTDLGNNLLKKNNNKKNYVYLFHSPVSVHKFYTKNAFDNYDYIFCNGEYQLIELKKLENLNKSKEKIYKKTGYLYFDYLNLYKNENKNNQILIAPSWNFKKENFTSLNSLKLIQNLLSNTNYKIIFRPHPEQIKRDSEAIKLIKNFFCDNENFFLDLSTNNTKFLKNSDLIITDYSGIALEFIMIFKRPAIFVNDIPKIHNKEFQKISQNTIEDDIKSKFGYQLKPKDLNQIEKHVQIALKNFDLKKKLIDEYLIDNFYNFGNSIKYTSEEILKILDQ